MALNSGKEIVRLNWYLIIIPYTLITHVNALGGNQTKIITLTDRHGRLIGDIETPGVAANLYQVEL